MHVDFQYTIDKGEVHRFAGHDDLDRNSYTTSTVDFSSPPRPHLFASNLTPANVLANRASNLFSY